MADSIYNPVPIEEGDNPFMKWLPYLGMGMTALGSIQSARAASQKGINAARTHGANAAISAANAYRESINSESKRAAIARRYKFLQSEIATTSTAAGFKPKTGSGVELSREATLNRKRITADSMASSFMIASSAASASRMATERARYSLQAGKHASRSALFEGATTLLGMGISQYGKRK